MHHLLQHTNQDITRRLISSIWQDRALNLLLFVLTFEVLQPQYFCEVQLQWTLYFAF